MHFCSGATRLSGRFTEGFCLRRLQGFALFPALDIVERVNRFPNVLHGDSSRRVFLKKWPGVITAFDHLFRSDSRSEVETKLRSFFEAVSLEHENERERALDQLAVVIGANSDKNRARLSLMARQAADAGLMFAETKIRRVVTGSAPNEVAWYPDERLTSWIYYEPMLRVPRNVHEGRDPGYGTMSQWRDEESHAIGPKLVFTTSTNPGYGLKALVVPRDWMVKSHGGESQQFHYTGLENPLRPPYLSGPNNLGDDAQEFSAALGATGGDPEDFLFYIAGIYNSQVAEDYLAGGGGNVMRIPLNPAIVSAGTAGTIIDISRRLRNLHWLSAEAQVGMDADLAETLCRREQLIELGMVEQQGSGGRFRQRRKWRVGEESAELIEDRISQLRPLLDDVVDLIYSE